MSEFKGTPGPWTIETPEQSLGSIDSVPTGDRVGQAFEVSVRDRNSGHPQRVANARLIAAAPELLEALTRLRDCYSVSHSASTRQSCWDQAIAAIAKATGAQP